MDELSNSLLEYNEQLSVVNNALDVVNDEGERDPLLKLQSELQELIKLTQENLDAISTKQTSTSSELEAGTQPNNKNELDDEYALFMQEMADTGVYDTTNSEGKVDNTQQQDNDNSDIEEELSTLLGMKCAVYHTHKWGGQPSLHNAMVCSVVPRQDNDQFKDLQVQVLYTHPTHAEMLPCPFYLNGECRFNDEQCRYSHGCVKLLSDLKDSIEPDFESLKVGSRVLMKLKPAESEDTSLTKKSSEKYHLWHRAIVIHIEMEKKKCIVKLEHGVKTGEKRKSTTDEYHVSLEEIFPLNNDSDSDSESGDSLSDTEYPESKSLKSGITEENYNLLVERSLETAGPAMGEWERHTRGIGSKLMLAMGYVPGSGLGAAGVGRVQPVEARVLPVGKSLDHCMAITEKAAGQDPLKVEQRLKRLQKKEEERNKRAYEREKERERRNVFNFLNKTLGNKEDGAESSTHGPSTNMKQSTNKDLNIEKFKIAEDTRKIERELSRLNSSLSRNAAGSDIHKNINLQIIEKNRELNALKSKEQQICKEQDHRKNKQNMVF